MKHTCKFSIFAYLFFLMLIPGSLTSQVFRDEDLQDKVRKKLSRFLEEYEGLPEHNREIMVTEELNRKREAQISFFLNNLKDKSFKKNEKKEISKVSEVAISINMLGDLRATQSVDALLERIDWTISDLLGGNPVLGARYPCALSLVEIGAKKSILDKMVSFISKESSRKKRNLVAWVLYKNLGKRLAKFQLINEAQNVEGKQKHRLEQTAVNIERGPKYLLYGMENKKKEKNNQRTQEEIRKRNKEIREKQLEKARKKHHKQVQEAIERVKELREKKNQKNK